MGEENFNKKLYAFWSSEISPDGLLSAIVNGFPITLITGQEGMIQFFREDARQIASAENKKIYLLEFEFKKVLETIEPGDYREKCPVLH